jgi:hypothetical protein
VDVDTVQVTKNSASREAKSAAPAAFYPQGEGARSRARARAGLGSLRGAGGFTPPAAKLYKHAAPTKLPTNHLGPSPWP